MAMVAMLVIACAVAVFREAHDGVESRFYDAPWFIALLAGLGVNLVAATVIRWPWRWRQTGFLTAHYGIVLILAGAWIGHRFGCETSLRLHTTEPVDESRIVFADGPPVAVRHGGSPGGLSVGLAVENGDAQVICGTPFRREVFALPSVLGKTIRLRDNPVRLAVEHYWPDFAMNGAEPASRSDEPNHPAIQVRLTREGDAFPETDPVLGFQVRLVRFEVPADEETGTPRDFRSTLCFTDPATGESREATVALNRPVSHPAGFWRTAMGLNTQFVPSQWNPSDLGETTLHARRDPGWPLKWIGSLMLGGGLAALAFRSRDGSS